MRHRHSFREKVCDGHRRRDVKPCVCRDVSLDISGKRVRTKPLPRPPRQRLSPNAFTGNVKRHISTNAWFDIAPPMPIANFFTEGMTMTHSASLRRSVGRLSGISRISLRTSPQFWRRSTSFLLLALAAETQAKAAMQSAGMTFFIRRALGARASVIVVVPDNDARPNNRDRDVDAVRERIQNVIQIVAAEVDVF